MQADGGPEEVERAGERDAGPEGEPPAGVLFTERLWPSPGYWFLVPLLGGMVALSLLPVSAAVAVPAAAGVAGLVALALARYSPTVAVTERELHAGPARVPLSLLGQALAFTDEQARQERGPRLDARAFLVVRGWVRPVVRVPVDDPTDPTPYWLLSTRRPEQLVRALGRTAGGRSSP